MKKLVIKEFTLAIHPTSIIFLSFSAMLMIPQYPYMVTAFYMTLAIFFVCINGRETQDVYYTASLPIKKRDIVKARMLFAVILQVLQAALCVPFILLRTALNMQPNGGGMDVNIALLGCMFLVFGVFNITFFSGYYKNVSKIGIPFVLSQIWVWLFIIFTEATTFIVPYVKNVLDTPDPQFIVHKLVFLAVAIIIFAVLTVAGYKISAKRFENQDL